MARRSVLFSPGDREELLRKAPKVGADTLVFDLEDAVSLDRKAEARDTVRRVLSDPDFAPDAEVCVRVNPGHEAVVDLEALLGDTNNADSAPDADAAAADATGGVRLDAVMIPKVSHPDQVVRVADTLHDLGYRLSILALVETAAGVLSARDIAAAGSTSALVFGAEDLAADLGATRTQEGTEVLYAREHVILAAAAADVEAIDTVYVDFEDSEGLREETTFAIELGYDGKLAIHPAQVPVINEAFTPDPDRIEWARTVLATREEADAAGRGVFSVGGEMIDAPLLKQAERIVERAEAADTREG